MSPSINKRTKLVRNLLLNYTPNSLYRSNDKIYFKIVNQERVWLGKINEIRLSKCGKYEHWELDSWGKGIVFYSLYFFYFENVKFFSIINRFKNCS
jgi:hypothetical protein